MNLKEWLAAEGKSLRAISPELEIGAATLSRITSGKNYPTFEQVVKIYVFTKGAVGLEDWIELNRAALVEAGIIPKKWRPHG